MIHHHIGFFLRLFHLSTKYGLFFAYEGVSSFLPTIIPQKTTKMELYLFKSCNRNRLFQFPNFFSDTPVYASNDYTRTVEFLLLCAACAVGLQWEYIQGDRERLRRDHATETIYR